MNKGLEALKEYKSEFKPGVNIYANEYLEIIEKELKDKEKKDKALEIINNKQVDIALLKKSKSAVEYNGLRMIMFKKQAEKDYSGTLIKYGLDQEEYDSLKEVFE